MKRSGKNSKGFRVTRHAAERYIERFSGNITNEEAKKRIQKILRTARRKRLAPGGGTVYGRGGLELITRDGAVLTIYRADTRHEAYALEA